MRIEYSFLVWRVIIVPKLKQKLLAVIFVGRVDLIPQTFLRANFTPQILYFTTQMFEG